jgi:uncharacterized protein (DUF2235 family)
MRNKSTSRFRFTNQQIYRLLSLADSSKRSFRNSCSLLTLILKPHSYVRIDVTVEFVGVWDTVSSVGIIPRQLPYSTISYGIKTFRHALALDECRARFRPSIWNEPNLFVEELDDGLIPERRPKDTPRDEWEYQPPSRTPVDASEVWFSG